MKKEEQQPPWLTNFAKIWLERVLRIETKSHQVWHHKIRGLWLSDVSLAIRARWAPPSPRPDRLKYEDIIYSFEARDLKILDMWLLSRNIWISRFYEHFKKFHEICFCSYFREKIYIN